jgi:hypothetical protein
MKKIFTTAAILFFLLVGCGPATQITSSWKADNIQPGKYKKLVVLGLVRENDRTIREKMEQHLVNDLKEMGYDAVCSCDEYNPKAFENLNEEQSIDKLRNSGVDAVLTVVLLDKTQERYYVPGRVVYSPYTVYQGRFWRYSRVMYDRIYTEGYYTTNTKYFWESNLYDLASNTLVYSSQSQSFDPFTAESLAHDYGQTIIKDMVKKNVLADLKQPVLRAM